MAAAHGCEVYAHEKPLPGEEHSGEAPALIPELALLEGLHEKQDINLQISASPQTGQVHRSSLSEEKTRCSKVSPHWLH